MVEVLELRRDASRNPLVQVMLQVSELSEPSLEGLEGLQAELLPLAHGTAKLDLSVVFQRCDDRGLEGVVTYATDLFDADRIERMLQHWLTLLHAVLESPQAAVGTLSLLPQAERARIEAWQQGPRIGGLDQRVEALFARQVQRTPAAVALIGEGRQLSYAELEADADRLAGQLRAAGVGAEVIVAVGLERSIGLIVALLAVLKAGGAYLPLDPAWPPERRRQLCAEAGCSVRIEAEGVIVESPPAAADPAPGAPLAYVCFTSGSTGTPKGVAVTHPAIVRLVDAANGFALSAGHRVLQLAPAAFDAATLEIWGPLLRGGTLVLAPPGPLLLSELADLLRHQRITTLWLTAGLFHAMVDHELPALAGVQQVLAGGDVLSPQAVERLLAAFPAGHGLINGYGPTENTTFTCCHRMEAGQSPSGEAVPIGRPIAMTEVRVLEPAGQPCPIGVPGELVIGGVGLARGYLHRPELTAERFPADPRAAEPDARLYRSGDLASWNADGTLAFHGRLDQQIKLRGFRIEPAEIAARLQEHPAVSRAVVVLRRDGAAEPRLVAYWLRQHAAGESRAEAAAGPQELRSFLADRLPDFMLPSAYVTLEALPLTANGKLDLRALPAPPAAGDPAEGKPPDDPWQQQLQQLWAEVLGHRDFGPDDSFFLVGGHSLTALRLSAAVERLWGEPMPMLTIFRHPTLAQQVDWLRRRHQPEAGPNLVTLQPRGERPPLYVIHGWGGTLGGYIDLARALAPRRPVLGLQAGGEGEPQESVTAAAARYAEQILARHDGGPIHLLGYSAGGWYAHAVAAALLQRGGRLGLFAVLDTHATARIHRRLGLWLVMHRLLPRLAPHLRVLLLPPAGQRRRGYLRGRLRAVESHLAQFLRLRAPAAASLQTLLGESTLPPPSQDPYVRLVREGYRPPRLPLAVDLFAPREHISTLRQLWRFYGRDGVRLHPMFSDHEDFISPPRIPALAEALEQALARAEQGEGGAGPSG
ncbi:MAG: amino acid adenylation domain-containing protein, partial [Synechococcaceae cyanobacterium]|nr:amino acid adenylation domain-containing protein [Synechococcaceae cyanobacterium]